MKKNHIELTDEQRTYLKDLLSKGSLRTRVQKRVMALLELDRGKSYKSLTKTLDISYTSAHKWGKRFKQEGLDFLQDKPRSGRPIKFDGNDRAKITALACSEAKEGYSQWSLRLLADRAIELELVEDISHTTVGSILKKTI